MLNKSDKLLVDTLKGVDLFLGGHEHGYFIYKNQNSIAIKSGSNFESFNEIILQFQDHEINETNDTPTEFDLKTPGKFQYFEKTATYNF